MKKIWLKSIAAFIVISMLLSVNVYAYDYPTYDVTLNSGDVVDECQYSEARFDGEYDPEFKCVKTVTINAFGEDPIVIKRSAFSGRFTKQVESLIINGTGKIILGSFAFASTGITEIDIPSNVIFESGAECIFDASAFLKKATIRSDLCPGMFSECWSLNYVKLLNPNIKSIPVDCFDTCGLLDITLPSSVTTIEDRAFKSNFYLKSVNFNEGLESIGDSSFDSNNSIKELKFPSTLKSIGSKCFYCASALEKLELNNGLETIGEHAFEQCRNLKSVTIPASVISIGEKAFGYYTTDKNEYKKYDGFTIYGYTGTAAEKYADENGFTFIPLDAEKKVDFSLDESSTSASVCYNVTVHSGAVVEERQYAELLNTESDEHYWINKLTIDANGTAPIKINDYGFAGANGPAYIRELNFVGSGDVVLGTSAFSFTGIESLTLPANIKFTENAEKVFVSCLRLKNVDVYCELVPGIFEDCNLLETVNLKGNITAIPSRSFTSAYRLKEIDIPATVESIGDEAFFGCYQMEKVTLRDGLKTIGQKAFFDTAFSSVIIPATVKTIGTKAFGYVSDTQKIDGFTIYGYTGTAAEKYADENGFTFIPLDAESSVEGVSYTPIWNSVNDYSFKVGNRPLKLQVIEANGATRTFTRHASNVDIKAYDNQGNEVHDTSADLAYEVWTVKTRLTPDSDLKVRAKYDNVWENAAYDFRVTTLYSDQTLKSAELAKESGRLAPVDCKIVTGSGVKKVRIEYEDGMTTTVNTSLATFDETNLTYTYNITAKPRHGGENLFKVYIKTSDGWKLATTLTYTAE